MSVQRVTFPERERIELYLRMRKKKAWIAKKLGRDLSVIKREISRNSGVHLPYTAIVAQKITERNARKTNTRKLEKKKNVSLKEFVESELLTGHSPEQIAGRLKEVPPDDVSERVCAETIYQYVYEGEGRMGGFYKKLRRKQKHRQSRNARKPQKERISERISIHKRPAVIASRKRYGDWETDSVIFPSQRSVLSVQVERKMKLCRLKKVRNKTATRPQKKVRVRYRSIFHCFPRSFGEASRETTGRRMSCIKRPGNSSGYHPTSAIRMPPGRREGWRI